jgi:hypothetical protein
MYISSMEQLVIASIVQNARDLLKNEEFKQLVKTCYRNSGNLQENGSEEIKFVQVEQFIKDYPDYYLTEKLIHFGQLIVGFIDPDIGKTFDSNNVIGNRYFQNNFNYKKQILETSGVVINQFNPTNNTGIFSSSDYLIVSIAKNGILILRRMPTKAVQEKIK